MKKAKLWVGLALVLTLALAGPAAAVVVNFDDIATPATDPGNAPIPAGYAGFSWDSNCYAENNTWYKNTYGNTVNFPSAPNAAFNGGALKISVSHPLFNLDGAYFSGWAEGDALASYSPTSLTVTGYNGGKVGSVSFSLTPTFEYKLLGFTNIDAVTFTAVGGDPTYGLYWLMDNMSYSAAPLPGAVWLLGSGLVGLIGLRRKLKR